MNDYLTAQQARHNMLEAQGMQGSYKKAETEEILTSIAKASKQGLASLSVSRGVDAIVASRLRTLGYTVKITSDQRDGDFMTITW